MAVSQSLHFIAAVVLVATSLTAVGGYAQLAETLGEELTPPSYADCSTNFTTLERALYDTRDNRFQIISTFYPARESVTVYAHVNYIFCENTTSDENCSIKEPERWWWTTGSFYLVQSPSVLRFTSLLFVYAEGRIGALNITLPMECVNVSRARKSRGPYQKEGMLEILTQRLKLYGQYNSLGKIVEADYSDFFAKAIPVNQAHEVYGRAVGGPYKLIFFFLLTLALPLITILMYILAYKSSRVELRVAFTNPRWYPTLASLIAIGVCFTMFVLGMDVCALVFAFDPHHYNEWEEVPNVHALSIGPFQFVIATAVMDMLCVAVGWGLLVVAFVKWWRKDKITPEHQIYCMRLLYFSFVGPIGCLGSHGCYMVVGWLTDPRQGGAIFLIYVFSFLFYLVLGRLLYLFCEDRGIHEGDGRNVLQVISTEYHLNMSSSLEKRKMSFFSLLCVIIIEIVFVCIKGYIIFAFAELPLVGVLQYMPQYLLSLFQIAVLIATIVLSYKFLTGDSPIDRQLLLGALENMKYLKQQQRRWEQQGRPQPRQERQQQQQLQHEQQPQQQMLQLVQQLLELQQRQQELLQQCLQRQHAAQPQDASTHRPQVDAEGEERIPQTDTEVQRAAAILGAIGHKLLFETLPPSEGDQSTLDFLEMDDFRHGKRRAVRDYLTRRE